VSKEETVEVTIKLPKPIAEWYRYKGEKLEERLTREIVELVLSEVEGIQSELLMEKFGLKQVFKDFGVLPDYYEDP